jgi:hypothetical protein
MEEINLKEKHIREKENEINTLHKDTEVKKIKIANVEREKEKYGI